MTKVGPGKARGPGFCHAGRFYREGTGQIKRRNRASSPQGWTAEEEAMGTADAFVPCLRAGTHLPLPRPWARLPRLEAAVLSSEAPTRGGGPQGRRFTPHGRQGTLGGLGTAGPFWVLPARRPPPSVCPAPLPAAVPGSPRPEQDRPLSSAFAVPGVAEQRALSPLSPPETEPLGSGRRTLPRRDSLSPGPGEPRPVIQGRPRGLVGAGNELSWADSARHSRPCPTSRLACGGDSPAPGVSWLRWLSGTVPGQP